MRYAYRYVGVLKVGGMVLIRGGCGQGKAGLRSQPIRPPYSSYSFLVILQLPTTALLFLADSMLYLVTRIPLPLSIEHLFPRKSLFINRSYPDYGPFELSCLPGRPFD